MNIKTLTQAEDWRDLYLERGQDMLDLAAELLSSHSDEDVELGLKIVEGAYFEEDEENPDAVPSLAHLNFDYLVKPLTALLNYKDYGERAQRCLAIIKLEKGEKEAANLDVAIANLNAKSESKNREAIEDLLRLAKEGVDISSILPAIMEREEKLALATDAMQLLVVYYIRQGKFDELEALFRRDDEGSIRIYRGLTAAIMNEFDVKPFIDRPGIMERLQEISASGKVSPIDDVLAGGY
jgi:hypothetical protein